VSAPAMLDRRAFLNTGAAAGGGLVIAFYVPALSGQEQKPNPEPIAPFAYIKIASDEKVTIVANHSEMGQGVYTSLPMLLNEELATDEGMVRRIRVLLQGCSSPATRSENLAEDLKHAIRGFYFVKGFSFATSLFSLFQP
jgi:CO/xanthine dehydrogenase Mo-binding subunit